MKSWKITDTLRRTSGGASSATSVPSHRTHPEVGGYSPAMILASVVLPDPLSPTIATTSPGLTDRLTPSSTGAVAPG